MIEQGSDQWFAQRCGKVTASRIADMLARTKSGWGASRANYLAQLVAERLTGAIEPGYTNAAMQWGVDTEPHARVAYEFYQDATVELAEFVTHPTIPMAGASPDGLVDADGLVEIKCPNTATHIETLLGGSVPEKYVLQMQWQMACTGRAWCDFVSFDPRMPETHRMFLRRLPRDGSRIADLENEVRVFLAEVDGKIAALNGLSAVRAPLVHSVLMAG
jgi:putative phage-type endonuclease